MRYDVVARMPMAAMSYSEPLQGEIEDLARILRVEISTAQELWRKRDVLKTALSSLQDILIEEGKASQDHTAIRLEKQKFLTKNLDEAKIRASRKQDEVDKLNITEPMERLGTTGTPTHQTGKWKLFHFTPDFHFNLSTTYPIRSVHFINEKKHSKWKSRNYEHGGTRFEAKMKNNPFRSASAGVELFGWPKEIHHEELFRKRGELLVAMEKQETLQQQVIQGYSDLEQLQSKNKAYAEAVDQCLKDLQKVQDIASLRKINRERLNRYIGADSIHGLAILLNLKSAVPVDSPMVQGLETELAFLLLYGQRDVFIKMREYITTASQRVNEIAQEKIKREWAFQWTAETLLNARIANDGAHIDFQKSKGEILAIPIIGMDDEQRTLVQKSQHAISKLQSDLEFFQKKRGKLFEESRKERLEQFDCRQETIAVAQDLDFDWMTNQGVISIMSAAKLPVGVVATFKVESTIPDAVSCIWRAERLKISEGKSMKH